MNTLSRRKRGPSIKGINTHVGSIPKLRELARKEHEHQIRTEKSMHIKKIQACHKLIEKAALPREVTQISDKDLIALCAKYCVVDKCMPGSSQEKKIKIATSDAKSFVQQLRASTKHRLTIEQIEQVAHNEGVFDDIWPFRDGSLENLYVPCLQKHTNLKQPAPPA